jgi:hypothetical protein
VQGVKALLAVAETRILGGRVGQRLGVVALPAETVGFLAVAEILLPGIGEDQEPGGIGAVGLVAGAAASVRDGWVDGLPGEPPLLVTTQAEVGDLGAEKFLYPRRVGAMTAGAPLALDGAVGESVGGGFFVAFSADPVDLFADGPPLCGFFVTAAAVPLGEGLVLQGIEEIWATRGMRIVAFSAGGLAQRVSPVDGAEVLEVVTAGAEAVLAVQQHELVVGAVIEMAGAAVPPADGEVNVGACKALDFVAVARTAPAIDALFEGRGFGEGGLLRRGRGSVGGGRRERRRCGLGFLAAAKVGFRPMTADAARAASRKVSELELETGRFATVERGANEPGIGR